MKKGRILKILFTLIMVISFEKVKAAYNGSGSPGISYPGTGSGSCKPTSINSKRNCQYENKNSNSYPVLQLQLIYASSPDSSWEHVDHGKTFYVIAPSLYNKVTKTYKINPNYVIELDSLSSCSALDYKCANKKLREYFGDDDNYSPNKVYVANKNLQDYLNRATGGDYTKELTKETEPANRNANTADKQAKKGYRIIIEPALFYVNSSFGIISPKDLAYRYLQGKVSGGLNFCSLPVAYDLPVDADTKKYCGVEHPDAVQGSFLYTDFWDIGVEPKNYATCKKTGYVALSQNHNGCGLNIIDVGKYIEIPKCYDVKTNEKNGDLECTNKDKNNVGEFYETYSERDCTKEESKKNTNTKYGKLIKENDNCSLYCVEHAKASLPGGIDDGKLNGYGEIGVNSYFPWPSQKNSTIGMKMFMESTYKCTIIQKTGKTCSNDNINTLQSAGKTSVNNLAMGAKLTGGNFNPIDGESLIETDKETKISEIDKTKKDNVVYKFTATRTSYFKISDNTNRYFSREKNAVSNKKLPGFDVDREIGVISLTEKKTEAGKSYPLSIDNIVLGSGNQFGKMIKKYECSFVPTEPCVCPKGTLNEGEELYINLTAGKSCTELQKTYCNICQCPDDSAYKERGKILNDQTKDIVGESMTSEVCTKLQKTYCYNTCVKETGETVLLSDCTNQKIKENTKLSEAEATRICEYEKGCICEKVAKSKSEILKENYKNCLNADPDSIENADYCYRSYCKDPCPNCDPDVCYKPDGTPVDISKCISDEQETKGVTYATAKSTCVKNTKECHPSGSSTCGCPATLSEVYRTCKKTTTKTEDWMTETWTCSDNKCQEVCHVIKTPCKKGRCSRTVVYRTIDLDNPFPADSKNSTTTRFSNTGTAGRDPGKNWNSEIAVTKSILTARGAKGNKLYEKKPLYTIVLTPQTIKEIKAYNKGRSYSDFNLNCTNVKKSAACISTFIHKTLLSLGALNSDKSVNNCFKIQTTSDEADFKNCYENNN